MQTIYLIKFQDYAIGKEFKSVNEPRHEVVVGSYEDLLKYCNDKISESDWKKFLSSLNEGKKAINVWLDCDNEPTKDDPESYDGYVSIDTDLNIVKVSVDDLKKLKDSYTEKIADLSKFVAVIDNVIAG